MTTAQLPTSEVLNLAADLIERRGWTIGAAGWPETLDSTAPLCLEGAIMAALGWIHDGLDNGPVDVETCAAGLAVRDYLNFTSKWLFMWNDNTERTQAEVIEVLRATALIESARESELAKASA